MKIKPLFGMVCTAHIYSYVYLGPSARVKAHPNLKRSMPLKAGDDLNRIDLLNICLRWAAACIYIGSWCSTRLVTPAHDDTRPALIGTARCRKGLSCAISSVSSISSVRYFPLSFMHPVFAAFGGYKYIVLNHSSWSYFQKLPVFGCLMDLNEVSVLHILLPSPPPPSPWMGGKRH